MNGVPNNSASEHPLITQPMLSSIPLSGEVLSCRPGIPGIADGSTTVRSVVDVSTVRSMDSDPRSPVRSNRTPDSLVVCDVCDVRERWGSGGTIEPSLSLT